MNNKDIIDYLIKQKGKLMEFVMDNSIMDEVVLINNHKLYYVAFIAMPVSLAQIIIFLILSPGNHTELIWRNGIIAAHLFLFIVMGIIGCNAFILRNAIKPNPKMYLLQYSALIVVIVVGAAIASIDQLVTTSITPFLVACIITGLLFLIKPIIALLLYILAFATFYYGLGLVQLDHAVLLSNRVNGITAVALGMCISFVLWRSNYLNIIQKRQIAEQKRDLEEKNKELQYLASYDELTGLFNRRQFEKLVKHELAMVERYGQESCIAIMDIDFFKNINDNYGHPVGDLLLKEIAILLSENTRETDLIARWGGEEFIMLFPITPLPDAILLSNKIRSIVENKIFDINGRVFNVTASFGVAPLSIGNFETIYRIADNALYNAKQTGRNR